MDILMDDNLPPIIAARLRGTGHDVNEVRKQPPLDNKTARTMGQALRERRILITAREDFTFFKHADHYGLLIVKLKRPNREALEKAVLSALKQADESGWRGKTVQTDEDTSKVWQWVEPIDLRQ